MAQVSFTFTSPATPNPSLSPINELPQCVPFESCKGVKAWIPPKVKHLLLLFTSALLLQEEQCPFWKPASSRDCVSLLFLFNRLLYGRFGPAPIKPRHDDDIAHPSIRALRRTSKPAFQRSLEDFEDLYYALTATVMALHEDLRVRIIHKFVTLDTITHEVDITKGTRQPISVRNLVHLLEHMFTGLNKPGFIKALDIAILRDRIRHHQAITFHPGFNPYIGGPEQRALRDSCYIPTVGKTKGILDLHKWCAGMISAHLNEKYAPLLACEKALEEKQEEFEELWSPVGYSMGFSGLYI